MNCIRTLYDHRPFERDTTQGIATSIAKRVLIGLIFTVTLAVGSYFVSMALYNNGWNPLNLSLSTQTGFIVANSCFLGILSIALTSVGVYHARKKTKSVVPLSGD